MEINRTSAFPPDLPAALDDPLEIRENDWQAFRRVDQMNDHWQRPGWTSGRRSYHWMLTVPHDAEAVRQLAAACQAGIARPSLDPVPLDSLHLTIGRIGFTDQVTAATAAEVARHAETVCQDLAAFGLAVGPLAGSRGAVRFSVSPWLPLITLHQRLTLATRHILGAGSVMDTARFRPHLSIAYANTTLPIASLLPDVEHLRAQPPATMTVNSVALVELRREGHSYRYHNRYTIKMTSSEIRGSHMG